jgi:hypothetical protein
METLKKVYKYIRNALIALFWAIWALVTLSF